LILTIAYQPRADGKRNPEVITGGDEFWPLLLKTEAR
jgi:hypothetical protein